MNKQTRLLSILDDVFGMGIGKKFKSQFRKTGQSFDERTNEHTIYIEYGVRGTGELRSTPKLRKRQPKKKTYESLLHELIVRDC
jgi:hypothetical protein